MSVLTEATDWETVTLRKNGPVLVTSRTTIMRDGIRISSNVEESIREPGEVPGDDDIGHFPDDVQAIISNHWSGQVRTNRAAERTQNL